MKIKLSKSIFSLILIILVIITTDAQIAINADGAAPHESAMLDVSSSSHGILIPRLSTDERDNNINNPVEGLIIYNTDKKSFEFFDGNNWIVMESTGKAWLLTGNEGTDDTQFLGTTDAQPLIIKTNNIERLRINKSGEVGIHVIPDNNYLLSAQSDEHIQIGRFVSDKTDETYAVYGEAAAADNNGYGGYFVGGYVGAYTKVAPTGSETYYGLYSWVSGGSGTNYGLRSYVTGGGKNYALRSYMSGDDSNFGYRLYITGNGSNYGNYFYITGDGDNYGNVSYTTGGGINSGGNFYAMGDGSLNTGIYSKTSGDAEKNYAFFTASAIEGGKGSAAYVANTHDTGTGIIALGSNVSTYYTYLNDGTALSATGKLFTITAHSTLDDDNTVVITGKYEGNDNSADATGIVGYSVPRDNYGYGIKGFGGWMGVYGEGSNGYAGIFGYANGSIYGVYSYGDMRAYGNFTVSENASIGGNLHVDGDFDVSGTKDFKIDHPLDPANKYLIHFSIESNEVLNVYRGNVILDDKGKATVHLPDYFNAVNRNFSYVLTPIGAPAPNIFIEKEIDSHGNFVIAGGRPGQKISWYVYAERNDPYLRQHPEKRLVEMDKKENEKGKYLRPELYGQPKEKAINYRNDREAEKRIRKANENMLKNLKAYKNKASNISFEIEHNLKKRKEEKQ